MKKYIFNLLMLTLLLGACSDDVNTSRSIFDDDDIEVKNEFDIWLYDNYIIPYNIELQYKFHFMETEFEFELTPVKFAKGCDFAQIIKYCWLEAYDEVAGSQFTRETSPKQITLIGGQATSSSATTSTSTLGAAEGGTSVVLYKINGLSDYSFASIIGYMHVMHHEFSHILAQKKPMDTALKQISEEWYMGDEWSNFEEVHGKDSYYTKGFLTPYSSRNEDEDYAEVYSQYLIMTDKQWADAIAAGNENGANGGMLITKKLNIVKDYIRENWGFELDNLRDIVRRRAEKAQTISYLTFSEEPIAE